MLLGDTPWAELVNEVANRVRTEVVGGLRNEFGPRHDRIIAEFAETRRELGEAREERAKAHQERDDLRKRLDEAVRRLEELEERNSFLEVIAQHLGGGKGGGHLPPELIAAITSQTPRPPSIDRACAADPKNGAQRVDLPQYGLVAYLDPNSPPEVTWGSLQSLPHQGEAMVHQGEGIVNDDARQAPHSPRTTRN